MTTVISDDNRRPRFELKHRLVLARETADMDQTKLAHSLGVARQTISNYERGTTSPRRAVLLAWAMATDVDVEWLLTGMENPHPGSPGEGESVPPTGVEPATYGTNVRRLAIVTPLRREDERTAA